MCERPRAWQALGSARVGCAHFVAPYLCGATPSLDFPSFLGSLPGPPDAAGSPEGGEGWSLPAGGSEFTQQQWQRLRKPTPLPHVPWESMYNVLANKTCMPLAFCFNLLSSLLPHLTFWSSTAVALPWCPHYAPFSVPFHLSSPHLQSFTHTGTYGPRLRSPFPPPSKE